LKIRQSDLELLRFLDFSRENLRKIRRILLSLGPLRAYELFLSQLAPIFIMSAMSIVLLPLVFQAQTIPPLVGGIAAIAGFVLSLTRPTIIMRLRFAWIYALKQTGEIVQKLSILALTLTLGVMLSTSGAVLPKSLVTDYISQTQITWLFLVLLEIILVGSAIRAYADVFSNDRLYRLCFRQAIHESAKSSKLLWATRGLSEFRKFVRDFGIDIDLSLFKREIGIRLVNGQSVNPPFRRLAGKYPIDVLKDLINQEKADFILMRKDVKGRIRIPLDALWKIIQIAFVVIAIVLTILAALGLVKPVSLTTVGI
jgi:hypothetical protein